MQQIIIKDTKFMKNTWHNLYPPCKLVFIINTQIDFIHELDRRRHPVADLPRFSLYYSLFRFSPNINPTSFDNPHTSVKI